MIDRPSQFADKKRAGFTLLELIVVIIIIAILVAFFLPATRRARPAARRAHCKNNLKNIGLALHNYHDVYGTFPPPYTVDENGRKLHSWRTLILPFIDQTPLYEKIDLSKPWDDPVNAEAYATRLDVYQCPSPELPAGHTTYLALVTPDSFFRLDEPRVLSTDTEKNSGTVMVVEVAPGHAVHWMQPFDADAQTGMGFGEDTEFDHSGGTHALFVDGSVKFLSAKVTQDVRHELMSYEVGVTSPF